MMDDSAYPRPPPFLFMPSDSAWAVCKGGGAELEAGGSEVTIGWGWRGGGGGAQIQDGAFVTVLLILKTMKRKKSSGFLFFSD